MNAGGAESAESNPCIPVDGDRAHASADIHDSNTFYQPFTRAVDVEETPSPDVVPISKINSLSRYATVRVHAAEPAYASITEEPDVMETKGNAYSTFVGF